MQALALPLLLSLALAALGPLARGPFAEWVLADSRQQLPALSLSLMALLLALSANIGVATMVGSFRTTFTGWLDQRLASELYVFTADEAEAARLETYLEGRADALLPILSAETRLFGLPADVFGIVDHDTYRAAWPLLSGVADPWDRLYAGEGILVNEQMARRHGLSLGDPVTVSPDLTLPVAGVYSDYGNPAGQAIVALDVFERLYPDARATNFAIRVDPEEAPALAALLREDFGLPEASVRNQAQIKAFSLEVFENTFLVTGALNILTLGGGVAGASDQPFDAFGITPAAGGAGLGHRHVARAAGVDRGLASAPAGAADVPSGGAGRTGPRVGSAGRGERGGLRLAPADAGVPGRGAAASGAGADRGGHRGGAAGDPALAHAARPPVASLFAGTLMTDLPALLDFVWSRLSHGVGDRTHPARHPTLATIGPDGPELPHPSSCGMWTATRACWS